MSIEEIFTWGLIAFLSVLGIFAMKRVLSHLRNRRGRDEFEVGQPHRW